MGGTWSGQRSSKKPVVEGRLAIDTADLRRMNPLVPGVTNRAGLLSWGSGTDREPAPSVGYAITVGDNTGSFRLSYGVGQPREPVEYAVPLVATGCHLGGVRWWFICPLARDGVGCGRRVRKVYLRGKYFGCRHCHGLTYQSRQESDSRVYAAVRGGFDLDRLGTTARMSVAQLGFALKVLTFEQKRLDRVGRRLDRSRRRKSAKGDVGKR